MKHRKVSNALLNMLKEQLLYFAMEIYMFDQIWVMSFFSVKVTCTIALEQILKKTEGVIVHVTNSCYLPDNVASCNVAGLLVVHNGETRSKDSPVQ